MDDVVIRAEGLGKKYVIGHQSNERYTALRDVITRSVKGFVQTAGDMVRGRPIYFGDELEEFWALKDINFEIKRGDVVGIIGRNGAGKSTLLKILSRITEPSEGKVEIRGRVASLLEVGTGFHPELTGRENIYLNGAILGMKREEIRRKFDEIIDFAGVEQFLDTPVKRYSTGMYVRLAFAIAAHLEPEILVIDEVLAVGDVEFQKKCLGKMQDVAGEGRTVLFVSHVIPSVRALCRSSILLEKGKVRFSGAPDAAIELYLQGNGDRAYEVTWPLRESPGDSDVRLLAMRVSAAEGAGPLTTSKPIVVEMEVMCHSIPIDLNIGFEFIAKDGISLFFSHFTDKSRDEWPRLKLGINKLQCTLPTGLLNAGVYFIAPRISIHTRRWIVELESPLSIEIHLDHGISPFWTSQSDGKRQGLITPILDWSVSESTNLGL